MNKRQKKKLENRAGFFHYKDYKWRVKLLYNMFSHKVVNGEAPCIFKQLMFEYAKNMLFTRPPKDIYRSAPFDYIVEPNVIPSMSARMVGDKIHSFSIDKDSFKNGYKPGELALPLPKGPLDGFKSMASAQLTPVTMTIEHGNTDRMRRRIMADEYIKGGSAIEYPSSAVIDLRKAVGRYGNMSIKGADKDISGPIHLGPIDLGPTDGELLEEHLDDLIDRHKRFASNSCEAMGMEVD